MCDTDDLLRFVENDMPDVEDHPWPWIKATLSTIVDPEGQHAVVPLNSVDDRDAVVCIVMAHMIMGPPLQLELIIDSVELAQLGPPDPTALDMAIWATMLEERIAQETNHPNHE